MPQELTWRVAGAAGFGIKAAGGVFSRAMARGGLSVIDYTDYPSLIRGGHNVFTARVSDEPITAPRGDVDVVVALNREGVDRHLAELADRGAIIFDPETTAVSAQEIATAGRPDVQLCPIPLKELATADGGPKIMANTVAIGSTLGLVDYPIEPLASVLQDTFAKKGDKVVDMNVRAARAGWDHAREHHSASGHCMAPVTDSSDLVVVDGNEAVGFGALAGGCRFYAAYPMTPASMVLHFMAAAEKEYGVVVKHTEDEIAAINMVIGAATAGARSMCATSGGGFSLMVEGLGLAGVTETPIVVGVFSRPGPATGMPTWTEQSDLRFVIHAAQGEFPRIVVVPGSKQECFDLAAEAFDLADEYQTPVIILSDMIMQESHAAIDPSGWRATDIRRGKLLSQADVDLVPRTDDGLSAYRFYAMGDESGKYADGVSPRALPGTKGVVGIRNSYDHDEMGWSSEDAKMRTAQNSKRMRKLDAAASRVPPPVLHGPDEADVTILTFGSSTGPVRDAMGRLTADGITVNAVQAVTVWPFPTQDFADAMKRANATLVVEGNLTGQFEGLIREQCLLEPDERLRKWDGRQFFPDEIVTKVKEVVGRG